MMSNQENEEPTIILKPLEGNAPIGTPYFLQAFFLSHLDFFLVTYWTLWLVVLVWLIVYFVRAVLIQREFPACKGGGESKVWRSQTSEARTAGFHACKGVEIQKFAANNFQSRTDR